MIRRLALLVLLGFGLPAYAQRTLTLEECLALARRQAPDLLQAEQAYRIASANAEASSLELRSKIDLNLSAPVYTDNTSPIYNPVTGTTDLLRQRQSQYGGALTLQQPIYWTGGSISVSGNLFRRAQEGLSGVATNDYLGFGTISLDQPIFVPNRYKLQQRESDIDLDLARSAYVGQYAATQYKVQSLFFNLYQAEQEYAIQKDVVSTSQQNYDLANNKFKAGLIAEVEALQLEVDLAAARTDLFDRERRLKAARRELLVSLGLPIETDIEAGLDTARALHVTKAAIDASSAIREALENRKDILAARYEIERAEIATERAYSDRAVSASLRGSFGATDNAVEISQLSTNPNLNRGLTLAITVPLFDWGAHATRMSSHDAASELAEIALKLKAQQVEQEVRSVIEQIDAARNQVEVAEKSVAVAQKVYDLSHARFDAGKITSQDLALDGQRLTRARLSALSAHVAELLAVADLTQKTLYDFQRGSKVTLPE